MNDLNRQWLGELLYGLHREHVERFDQWPLWIELQPERKERWLRMGDSLVQEILKRKGP